VAVYAGYFGAAGGVLMLALLWAFVPLLAAGFGAGGYLGQQLVRHLPARLLRAVVAVAGLALAVKLGVSAYR
jgi:uncharacterized membrane protein YfcA